jgi:hypothetical protein
MFFTIAIATASLWLISIGAMMETKNLRSSLAFKVLPAVLGAILGLYSLKGFGVL